MLAVVVAGGIGVTGTIVGVVMTTWLGRSAERRRLAAEDDRRWLADRRRVYAAFLVLSQSMLREIDGVAVFLPYRGDEKVADEDEAFMADGLMDYFGRWNDQIQPALSDVQLVAGSGVADLADGVSGALMEITVVLEKRGPFVNYYPGWFRAQDLLGVLRNAMRAELGLNDAIETDYPRGAEWPWLQDRPSEEEYIRRQTEIPGRPPLTPSEKACLAESEDGKSASSGAA
ncbi:hypothetical protein [Phytoactinopolyspora mesophila]|uniref:DUF4760 domain-containing protein n=1 Tax=Phytoactinopolyspora mesophila TaxID=2650750 RepID=A0A7K3M1X1_9ACTN|nr:hypothetical protein [Phytoactinopolyspora mesophila]NDL57037.1 hypothetical protein [Phytoactinopolyspora mesophila]